MEIFNYYFEIPSNIPALNVTSIFFIAFVLLASFLLFINKSIIRNIVIFILSIFFIWSFSNDGYFLLISLIFCIYTYIASYILNKQKEKKIYIIVVILPIIGLLLYKNAYIFNQNIIIPLGISFYVLRLVWYLKQIYNNEIVFDNNPLYIFNYLLFFPCFSAGPIEKPEHFINQLKKDGYFSYTVIKEGWFRFLYGIFEKIVICDFIGSVVNRILPIQEIQGINVFFGIILYSFQIYLDFDSYSNIAIGVSKICGIDIKENFKTPYLSQNIKEFWSRWHISLSTWLKENVYIPLGGNKNGKTKKIINIFIVFIISGIWHGSTLNFVIWGAGHAILRVIEDYIEEKYLSNINQNNWIIKIIRIIINFCLVTLLWIVFKYDNINEIINIINRAFVVGTSIFIDVDITVNEIIWLVILLIYVVSIDIIRYRFDIFAICSKFVFPLRFLIYFVGIIIFLVFGVYGGSINSSDFIYRWF